MVFNAIVTCQNLGCPSRTSRALPLLLSNIRPYFPNLSSLLSKCVLVSGPACANIKGEKNNYHSQSINVVLQDRVLGLSLSSPGDWLGSSSVRRVALPEPLERTAPPSKIAKVILFCRSSISMHSLTLDLVFFYFTVRFANGCHESCCR